MSSATSERTFAVLMIGTSPETQGGVSTVVREIMASALVERHSVRYLATHSDGGVARKMGVAIRAVFAAWCLLLFRRPQLVHVHLASRASFWRKMVCLWPAYLLRVPVLMHLHGAEFREFYERECGLLSKAVVRCAMNGSRQVVALSSGWKSWLTATFTRAEVTVIHNSVALPASLSTPTGGTPNILFMGRLGQRKGTFDLLQAFAKLPESGAPAVLLLAGDGDIDQIRALAIELGVSDRVRTLGWVAGEERTRLYREASVFVLPSYNEGLPMSVLEAMSFGLPVVTTPVGGIPDAVEDGSDGFLVSPGDIDALASRLGEVLASPETAAGVGKRAREKIERQFATSEVVNKWLALYAALGVRATGQVVCS